MRKKLMKSVNREELVRELLVVRRMLIDFDTVKYGYGNSDFEDTVDNTLDGIDTLLDLMDV